MIKHLCYTALLLSIGNAWAAPQTLNGADVSCIPEEMRSLQQFSSKGTIDSVNVAFCATNMVNKPFDARRSACHAVINAYGLSPLFEGDSKYIEAIRQGDLPIMGSKDDEEADRAKKEQSMYMRKTRPIPIGAEVEWVSIPGVDGENERFLMHVKYDDEYMYVDKRYFYCSWD